MFKDKHSLLIKELISLIEEHSKDSKVKELIEEEFIKRNMLGSKGTNILTGNRDLGTFDFENEFDLIDLFIFTVAMYKALKILDKDNYEKINVNKYFTPLEISKWSDYKAIKKEVSKYPYVFKNMIKVCEGHYVGRISVEELVELDSGNDVLYNFRTQRNPKINIFGFKEINIDKAKIAEIETNLLNDEQFPTEIKINVLKTGEDGLAFKSKDGVFGDLFVNSGIMNLFDGMHRKTANSLAYLKKKHGWNFYWKLEITNLSEKRASDYMVEINKQKPISKEHVENMNSNKAENVVVDFIKDIPMNDFSDMITESNEQIVRKVGLTKKSLLATAILECFSQELVLKANIRPLSIWISEVINYIIGLNFDSFLGKTPSKVMTNKNIFIGYIGLAKEVYGLSDWKDKVKEILKGIDFSETNAMWKDEGLFSPQDANKTLRNKLYKIFSL